MQIEAWQVHDSGLVAAPGPFRRLPGAVRHHRGQGEAWPVRLALEVTSDELVVHEADGRVVGRWPLAEVGVRRMAGGPPVTFVVQVPGAAHLLAAAAGPAIDGLLDALAP